jgi:hypothetical protein
METVVSLRARSPWEVAPVLALAVALGGGVAACCVAIVFGVGVTPQPSANVLLLVIAALALAPAPVLARRWHILRPPSRLVLDPEALTIAYPEMLRQPFAVRRAQMRVAAIDDDGPHRFRVHGASGPYWGGQGDGYLWSRGSTALPVLAPEGVRPNLLLLFDEPVGVADVRRSRLGSIYRGEHVAGLLLAAKDPRQAERALAPFTRPLTMPDVIRLEEHLTEGGRFALAVRHLVHLGWGLIAVGAIAPVLAALGGALGLLLVFGGRRAHGAALAVAGLGVFAVRLVLWLG